MTWTPKLVDALEHNSIVTDVSSDQQQKGLESYLDIDRDTTARLGISPLQIDNTLYDAFGQRQVSVIYSAINQYHVVMEIDPRYTQYPNSLRDVYVSLSGATPPGTATTNAPGGAVTAATANGTAATPPPPPLSAFSTTTAPPAAYSAASASSPASTTSSAAGKSGLDRHIKRIGRDIRQCPCGAQRLHQRAGQYRPRPHIRRRSGQHGRGNHDPAGGRQPLPAGPHAVVRQSSGIVRCLDHIVQFAAG